MASVGARRTGIVLLLVAGRADALDVGKVRMRAQPSARRSAVYAGFQEGFPDGLAATYESIAQALPQQQAAYEEWVGSAVDADALRETAADLGLALDVDGGQVAYAADFESKRVPLCFDFVYCRHGKTTGNTEPRVYQGYVDEPSNALNGIGRAQAEEAADKLDALSLKPDLVILSPLARAADTGLAYIKRHPELESRVEYWEDAAEMRFGAWDNVMVKDLGEENICHLFYLTQNAIVKPSEPYVRPSDGKTFEAENFVEMAARMQGVLRKLDGKMRPLAEEAGRSAPPLVVMYGHSMAGAALSILTGNGKAVDGEAYLGFDGKYIMPNATPVYLVHQAGGEKKVQNDRGRPATFPAAFANPGCR